MRLMYFYLFARSQSAYLLMHWKMSKEEPVHLRLWEKGALSRLQERLEEPHDHYHTSDVAAMVAKHSICMSVIYHCVGSPCYLPKLGACPELLGEHCMVNDTVDHSRVGLLLMLRSGENFERM